jgi:translation initiation factor 5B
VVLLLLVLSFSLSTTTLKQDMLVSKLSRRSIDVLKEFFKDDLSKEDWALVVKLKKTFQIV